MDNQRKQQEQKNLKKCYKIAKKIADNISAQNLTAEQGITICLNLYCATIKAAFPEFSARLMMKTACSYIHQFFLKESQS